MNIIKTLFKSPAVAVIIMFLAFAFTGCSKDAEDSANGAAQSSSSINGTWKETTTGFTVRISGVSSSNMGVGIVAAVGTAFPSSALNGQCMSEVEYIRGGYWEAYNNTYYPGSGWSRGGVVGLAMNETGTQFKIGSKIYVKQ